jgi:GNAT superfamily N-acetyltransferase
VSHASFSIEPLNSGHDRTEFACGVEELDRYLRERAGQDMRRRVSAAFVLLDSSTRRVVGFYTLSGASIERGTLPADVSRPLPRYRSIPAILLGRLAADERYRGQGLGSLVLIDALRRSLSSASQVGAFAVVVDAIDERARAFYEHYGFIRFHDDEQRLFLPLETIAKLLA